jgi:DNA-binding transcriptional ArsR family regulator
MGYKSQADSIPSTLAEIAQNAKLVSQIGRALNHKLRQRILELIEENGEMTVTEIWVTLRLEQTVASTHVGILRDIGVVKFRRDGKFKYYALDKKKLESYNRQFKELIAD